MSASFVVDSSVAMAWCFRDEATPETEALFQRMGAETAMVPSWWFLEITNVLALTERRKRISAAQVSRFIALLESFAWEIDDGGPSRAFTHILGLCRSHSLTAYDALYLDLAITSNLPLATLDEPRRAAGAKFGVKLLGK